MKPPGMWIAVVATAMASVSTVTAATPRALTVDLGTGTINGHAILGNSLAEVTKQLGKPDWRVPGTRKYRIGYGQRTNFTMMVRFTRKNGTLRAVTVAFERPPLLEKQIGTNVLAMTPRAFQHAVARSYGNRLTIGTPRRCIRGLCSVTLRASASDRRITFGTRKPLGAFLTIWLAR